MGKLGPDPDNAITTSRHLHYRSLMAPRVRPTQPEVVGLAKTQLVLAICLVVGISFVIGASLTFLLTPMLDELGLTEDQAATALAIPSIASLLVVFLAGRVGDRIGHRRVMLAASAPFVIGSILVAAAPGIVFVSIGLVLAGAAATALQIVCLGLLQSTVPSGSARVSAFASFGMMYPAVYLVIPVLTGWLVGVAPWRVVPAGWAVLGLLVPIVVWKLIPPAPAMSRVGELWTPTLAGLGLACVVETINNVNDDGWQSAETIGWLAAAIASLVCCAVALRVVRSPALSLISLRNVSTVLLLSCVALIAMANTLTYVMLGLEYLYGTSVLGAALYLVPAQAAAVVGSKLIAAILMRRLGNRWAGVTMLTGFSLSLLTLLAMTATSPISLLVTSAVMLSLFGFGAITIVNAQVMTFSPVGESGILSAYRGAASSIGTSLGVVVLGAAISTIVLRVSTSAPGQTPNPEALADGLKTNGIVGACLAVLALASYLLATREKTASRPGLLEAKPST